MQYKIPVQIEMADRIIFGLSLKQLAILLIGSGTTYQIFTSLSQKFGIEFAIVPSVVIGGVTLLIVFFKRGGMTFFPYILSLIRFNINLKERQFVKWIDSFQPIEIGYLRSTTRKQEKDIDFESKIDKIKKLENQLDKI